jgi:hypothetical protein
VPYRFAYDYTNRVLQGKCAGRFTDEDATAFYRMTGKYLALLAARAGVTDLSAVTSFTVSAQTVRQLAKTARAMSEPLCPCVIVAPSPQIFVMARMFELEGEVVRPNVHVVRNLKEAWAIVGLHNPAFKRIPSVAPL